jgi:c-di-GMP-binding flagellar brake protein YcgR
MVSGGTPLAAWVIWSMLGGGAALSLAGLWRSGERFWHWRQARQLYGGETVLAADLLSSGQEVRVTPHTGSGVSAATSHGLPASVTLVGKRTVTLYVETGAGGALVAREPIPDWVKLGMTVSVAFTGVQCLFRFDSRVLDASGTRAACTLTLARPHWLERIQRRQHFRVALSLPATFEQAEGYYTASFGGSPLAPPHHGTLIDLSVGGLCARLECGSSPQQIAQLLERFAPDTILRVRLPIPALSGSPVLIRVRDCRRVVVSGGLGVVIACMFLVMPAWEQELVASKVFEVQRAQLRSRRT